MLNKSSSLVRLACAALVAGAAASANATPIIGTANLSFGLVAVSLGEIDWNPPLNPGFDPNPTYGSFLTSSGANTGVFAAGPMSGVTGGLVQDMSANPADGNFVPVGPGNTPNFLSFTNQPGWTFSVTSLTAGTFPGAPYVLTQVGGNVSATITVDGYACDTEGDMVCDATDDVTRWTGIFSAQYTGITVAEMAAIIQNNGTLNNNTWSATIEAFAIPEPSTLALVGLALTGFGAYSRRRRS